MKQHLVAYITLVVFLIIGINSYKDFGISWDEVVQRKTGEISYNYIVNNDTALFNWCDRDYGVAFELPLIVAEKQLSQSDEKSIYQLRHLLTYLFFLVGALFFYWLLYSVFKNKMLSLVGLLLYLLHPRILADSFYNTKDIPFLSMYSICLYWTNKAFKEQKLLSFFVLSILIGLLINIRLMGILLFAIILIYLLIDMGINIYKKNGQTLKCLKAIFIFVTFSTLTLYLSWPILWTKPIDNFLFAWNSMSQYKWDGNVLLGGQLYKASQLPWFYIPYWFSATTPMFSLFLGLLGSISIIISVLKSKLSLLFVDGEYRIVFIALGSFMLPIIAVIVLHSCMYDAWRQVFFIYPSFVILGIYFLEKSSSLLNKKIIYGISIILTSTIAVEIYQMFPLSNVYFNNLVSRKDNNIRKNYELDYWGLSYKKCLEYILQNDPSKEISINGNTLPCATNLRILFSESRLKYSAREDAQYFITNYRTHPEDYEEYKGKEFYSIVIDKIEVCTVFKLK